MTKLVCCGGGYGYEFSGVGECGEYLQAFVVYAQKGELSKFLHRRIA